MWITYMLSILVITIFTAVKATTYFRDSRSIVGALWALPGVVGGILIITIPGHRRIGLLFSYWTASELSLPFLSSESLTMCAYSLGNRVFPSYAWMDGIRDSWTHEKDHYERNCPFFLFHWQCSGSLHVESGVSATVRFFHCRIPYTSLISFSQ